MCRMRAHPIAATRFRAFVLSRFPACVLSSPCYAGRMAVLIGIVSQNGDVGKSTLARLIAREYAKAGWSVKVADLDAPQGTQLADLETASRHRADRLRRAGAQAERSLRSPDSRRPPHSTVGTLRIAQATDLVVPRKGLAIDGPSAREDSRDHHERRRASDGSSLGRQRLIATCLWFSRFVVGISGP